MPYELSTIAIAAYTLSALPIVVLTLQFVPLPKSANLLRQRGQIVQKQNWVMGRTLSKIGLWGEL